MWGEPMKKDNNEKLDVKRLNEVIKTGGNILKLSWVLMLVGVILLVTFLIKEWNLLEVLAGVINVISPLFIGIIIAWLLDPLVSWLQKNGVKRGMATVLVFLGFLSLITLFLVIMIPALASEVNEFISFAPSILEYIKNTGESIFTKLTELYAYDFEGKRYDVGDKLGFLEATVDFALKRPELRDGFIEFLKSKSFNSDCEELQEVAVTVE